MKLAIGSRSPNYTFGNTEKELNSQSKEKWRIDFKIFFEVREARQIKRKYPCHEKIQKLAAEAKENIGNPNQCPASYQIAKNLIRVLFGLDRLLQVQRGQI